MVRDDNTANNLPLTEIVNSTVASCQDFEIIIPNVPVSLRITKREDE